ncbi:extracellular solute-binding protein [Labedaea rhizosphaerae]|uniref:Carbohydrate ABC transporter substrate-binding protein (CUT1 family) n=1 Tax=Labedaea rhizosphaerae TaxID=598644 RepID=A0A4R6SGV5_LABRH|nr:extracellular solute-binding protein [Labedaea rhizosphaerae]TDQ00807.1 carbohydrate ABC transporter substrate-binding protein (CUT1 family) [Labedaea rhizosphaerae]
MRRALGSVAAASALALALAACGGSDTPTAQSTPTTQAVDPATVKADLTWWDTSDATNEAPEFKKLIAQFNKTYPNVHVNYQSVPFGEAQNKFKNAAKAKSGAPDILRADVGWVSEFASLGYLYNLDDTELVKDQQDFLPVPLASTKFNGKTYGVPQVTDSLALMYNKKLLQQAGVQPPKTWDEMVTASATIKQKTGKDGTFLNPAGYYLLPFIYGEGGDLVDAQQKKIVVNAPEAVAGSKKAAELVKKPGFTKPPATDAYNAMMTAFKSGKVAMIVNGPWELNNIKSADGFGGLDNLGLTTVPAGTKKSGSPVGGHDYVVWSGMPREKAAAAIAFIKFMTSADTEAQVANDIGLLPPRASAYAKVTNPVIAEFKPMMDSGVGRAWIPEAGQLFAPMDEAATKIMVQGVDAQTALDGVAKTYKSEVVPDYAGG